MRARTVLPAGATREEWLAARLDGIGGSEIGAILGQSPWATPMDVWAAKVHGETTEENDAMRVGNALEAGVLALGVANLAGPLRKDWQLVSDLPALLAHPDHDVIRYSPDGIATDGGTGAVLLEAKVTSKRLDEPPPHWVSQVQWGLYVTGLTMAQITAVNGSRAMHWQIFLDEDWERDTSALALQWWEDYVVAKTPPPPTTLAEVAKWWTPEPGTVYRPHDYDAWELLAAREAHEAASAEADAAKDRLDKAMVRTLTRAGNVAALDLGEATVKLSRVTPNRLNGKALAADHPSLAEQYTQPGNPQIKQTWKKATK